MINAIMLGNGGSNPTINRYLSSAYLKVEGTKLLMDCGEGTQVACAKAGVKIYDISVICLTHAHGDHILGLPGLLTSIDQILKVNSRSDKKTITIIGPKSCKGTLFSLLATASICKLSINYVELYGSYQKFYFSNFVLEARRVKHTVDCYGYSVQEITKPHFSSEKAKICNAPEESWKFMQSGHKIENDGESYDISDITEGDASKGAKVVYVTDTAMCDGLEEIVQDADLAIMEGMHFSALHKPKLVSAKHLTFEEAAQTAQKCGVKKLWLTHFSPTIIDPEIGLRYATAYFPNTECARCGLSMEVVG